MRDIKIRVLFEITGRDFVTSIKSHYTTVERLMNGQDNFKYSDVNIIARSQFTGLTDKNGVEIYESDTVKVLFTDWPSQPPGDDRSLDEYLDSLTKTFTVEFYNSSFQMSCPSYYSDGEIDYTDLWCGKHGYIEVIGNIHENPELLNK